MDSANAVAISTAENSLPARCIAAVTRGAISLSERGWLPDTVLRAGIRRLTRERLLEICVDNPAAAADLANAFVSAAACGAQGDVSVCCVVVSLEEPDMDVLKRCECKRGDDPRSHRGRRRGQA